MKHAIRGGETALKPAPSDNRGATACPPFHPTQGDLHAEPLDPPSRRVPRARRPGPRRRRRRRRRGHAVKGIEAALVAAQQDKRGVTIYVAGQTIAGAVTKVEPGAWVEMKNQTSGRIIVRIDRIDGIAAP